jgi:hypothetical protein
MLNEADLEEAASRYKNIRLNGHERVRYHALLLVSKGYNYRETVESDERRSESS